MTEKTKYNDNYWKASHNGNTLVIGNTISYTEAQIRVQIGLDIMCKSQMEALDIASQYPIRKLEIDKNKEGVPGYYWHYHINGRHGFPHIWFYGLPIMDY